MKKQLVLLLLLTLLATRGSVMAKDYSKEIRTIKALKSTTAPVLNGDLSDNVWAKAQKEKDFRQPEGKELSKAKTEVMTCWTSSALYIGMICYEPDMKKIKRKYMEPADRFTWKYGTDEIELFITPNYENPEVGYFHFVVSAGGQIYQKYHRRIGANSFPKRIYDIKVATKEFDNRWQAEPAPNYL